MTQKELEEIGKQCSTKGNKTTGYVFTQEVLEGFLQGANYVLSHAWQEAQGDILPPIDKEVIVLCQDYPEDKEYLRVAFSHRINPEPMEKIYFDGHTENVYVKSYDGWNIPNVKFWLDIELPNK